MVKFISKSYLWKSSKDFEREEHYQTGHRVKPTERDRRRGFLNPNSQKTAQTLVQLYDDPFPSSSRVRLRTAGKQCHSKPKVPVSSTAVSILSYSMEKDGYGGRSSRLKQVWALERAHKAKVKSVTVANLEVEASQCVCWRSSALPGIYRDPKWSH